MKNSLVIFLFTVIGCGALCAQEAAKDYPWQVGIGAGFTNYYGDVSNYRINKWGDIGKIYHFVDFNHYYVPQPSFSLLLEKKINPAIGFMVQLNHVSFSMSDRYRNKDGTLDLQAPDFARALNFKTSLQDLGFALTFSSANGHTFKETSFFYPSFFIGGGVAAFNVYGDLYDANGNRYDYTQNGNINDGNYETNLRDVKTETQTRYSNITPYLDFGLSLNFRLTGFLSLSLQSDIKYAGTDYLDDVSGRYKSSYSSSATAYAAHPGTNTVNPVTLQRGDMNSVNDTYINNRLVLHVNLGQTFHKKQSTAFNAPVLYSLAGTNEYHLMPVPVRTDSLQHGKDTVLVKRDTIPFRLYDTAYQQRVEHRLNSIQSQLKGIKTVLRNQAYESAYQYLRFEQDSVKRIKKIVQAQKIVSKEDNLKLRIYDLQIDSLRYEMEKMQRRAEAGMEDSDSNWLASPGYQFNNDNGTNSDVHAVVNQPVDSIKSVADTMKLTPADSVTDVQIVKWNQEVDQLKTDQRYAKDSSYHSTIDSLNNKLQAYETMKSRDTVVITDSLRKDTIAEHQLRLLKASVQKNNDSLAVLQASLQQNRDSAAYYKRLAFAANEQSSAAARHPKKWYQRIIPGRSKKEDKTLEDESQRINGQTEYYDATLQRLTEQVNALQQRNLALNNDYERTSRRVERVYSPVQPVTRETRSSARENNELREMRNEISALRNQLMLQQAIENGMGNHNVASPHKNTTDTVYIQVPPPANNLPVTTTPNPQMIALQLEISRIKAELDAVKSANTKNASVPLIVKKDSVAEVTVYFASGSANLSAAQQNKLSVFMKRITLNKNTVVTLSGYTDAKGNISVNNALAKKRMNFVQNILVTQFDIPVERLHMNDPVTGSSKTGKENPLDRKVTITIEG